MVGNPPAFAGINAWQVMLQPVREQTCAYYYSTNALQAQNHTPGAFSALPALYFFTAIFWM